MKIQFKVASTTYTVQSPEKQALIEAYCAKITRRTGRHTAGKDPFPNKPKFPRFFDGMSTAHYVREYEAISAARFHGAYGEVKSLFDNLSTNPQFKQDDSHIEEVEA